MVPQISMPH
jgi:hypothetical protein